MAPKRKPNIIFITCDALRADHLGFMGYRKNTSPFLDSLANGGIFFKNAFSVGSDTAQSFVAIFTSTYPTDFGGYSYIDRPRVVIAELLKKEGYKTIGAHSTAFASSYFGYDRGWDELHYATPTGPKTASGLPTSGPRGEFAENLASVRKFLKTKFAFRTIYKLAAFIRKVIVDIADFHPPYLTAGEINEEVKKNIPKAPEKPVFLWVHYMDIHTPFALFAQSGKYGWKLKLKYYVSDFLNFLFEESPLGRIFRNFHLDLYDASIKYVDGQIKELFKYLASIDILNDDSVVIISADHGNEFYEHGTPKVGRSCFNTAIHVPLIFYGPKLVGNGVVRGPVSQIDLAPTILKLAGGSKPPKTFKGRNVFDAEERPVVSQVHYGEGDLSQLTFYGASVVYRGYKLIHLFGKKMLFSLRDTEEKNNLYDKEKDIVGQLEKILEPYEVYGRGA